MDSVDRREGGQWVELPSETDEPFESDVYYVRRFALTAVRCYISAIERDEAVLPFMSRLQSDFNERCEYFSDKLNFRLEFLKYLRLCGGDRCLHEAGDAYDMWVRNFESGEGVEHDSGADFIDTVDTEYENSDDEVDDIAVLNGKIGEFVDHVHKFAQVKAAVASGTCINVIISGVVKHTQQEFILLYRMAELLGWSLKDFSSSMQQYFIIGTGRTATQWRILYGRLWISWTEGVDDSG